MAIQRPKLKFLRGTTYIIDQSDSSNAGHPLRFTADSGATEYTTGVTATGTPGQAGAKTTFVVPNDAPENMMYYCTAHGIGMGQKIKIVTNPSIPSTKWYGDRALVSAGLISNYPNTDARNQIEYFDITTNSNSSLFGELFATRYNHGSLSDETRAVFAGGNDVAGNNLNSIEYITSSTTGNGSDFGDLYATRVQLAGVSNGTRGIFASHDYSPDMEHITIQTTGNGSDFGDLSNNVLQNSSMSGTDGTYGLFAGGLTWAPVFYDVIQYVTISTAGNTQDFGDLSVARGVSQTSIANDNRVCFAGGNSTATSTNSDVIDYVVASTPGNATDLGNLSIAMRYLSGTNNGTTVVVVGGSNDNGTTFRNDIQKFTIDIAGNASDFGDLAVAVQKNSSTSANAS